MPSEDQKECFLRTSKILGSFRVLKDLDFRAHELISIKQAIILSDKELTKYRDAKGTFNVF